MHAAFDLEDAWEKLAEMIGWIVALFGAPSEIAQSFALTRRSRAAILAWLAPLEALARRLLCIEAAALPAPNAPAAFAPKGRLASALRDAPPAGLAEDSAQWRVVFNLGAYPGPPASGRLAPIAGWKPSRRDPLNNAAPLATRLEALLRLAANRERAVIRLARRLHARPRDAIAAFAPFRHPARACESALAEAQGACDAALARFADTS